MAWQELRLKTASGLLIANIVVNSYGVVALLLFKYNAFLPLGYMGMAVLTIPKFILVQFLSTAETQQKPAAERNRRERLFIRLYDMNLLLAVGIWTVIVLVSVLKEKL